MFPVQSGVFIAKKSLILEPQLQTGENVYTQIYIITKMTTMIDSVFGEAGVRSNSSMFGTFFLFIPWHYVCRFSRKNLLLDFWKKLLNFSLQQSYYNEKFGTFSQQSPRRFFLENQHIQCQGIYKKTSPTWKQIFVVTSPSTTYNSARSDTMGKMFRSFQPKS